MIAIDKSGRMVIPKEIRNILDLQTNDYVTVETDGNHLMLSKTELKCFYCGEKASFYHGQMICRTCLKRLEGKK